MNPMDFALTRDKAHYPGQLGVAGSDNELGLKRSTQGTVLYVDSTHPLANNANDGTDPDGPLATWAGAIAKCTANHGDVILLAPRHRETWATLVGSANLSVAGVTTIGQGAGLDRPRITMTNAASTLTINGASNVVQNVVLVPGVNHVTIGVTVTGTDAALENVEFADGGASHFLSGLTVVGAGAADRLRLSRVTYFAATAGSAQAVNLNAVEDRVVIEDCRVYGDFTAAAILSGSVLTDLTLSRNVVQNLAAGIHAVELTAAATGVAVGNYLVGTVLGTIFDPGSLRCLDNWEANAVDSFGVPSPYNAPAGLGWPTATGVGVRVTKAAADINDGTQKPIFTIAGGDVLLVGLRAVVSVAAMDAGANNSRFIANPTVGADMNLCANLDTVAAAVGATFSITGVITDPMTGAPLGGGAMSMDRPVILKPGSIDYFSTADKGTGGGLMAVDIWYIPVDSGATVTAI